MSNKTKEEIEQLAGQYYSHSYSKLGFIHGYTQCQETLNARIVELEAQLVSCKEVKYAKKGDYCAVCGCTDFHNEEE